MLKSWIVVEDLQIRTYSSSKPKATKMGVIFHPPPAFKMLATFCASSLGSPPQRYEYPSIAQYLSGVAPKETRSSFKFLAGSPLVSSSSSQSRRTFRSTLLSVSFKFKLHSMHRKYPLYVLTYSCAPRPGAFECANKGTVGTQGHAVSSGNLTILKVLNNL